MTVNNFSAISSSALNDVAAKAQGTARDMDLSVLRIRNGGRFYLGKLASFVCFLTAGAILATALLQQNGIVINFAAKLAHLF